MQHNVVLIRFVKILNKSKIKIKINIIKLMNSIKTNKNQFHKTLLLPNAVECTSWSFQYIQIDSPRIYLMFSIPLLYHQQGKLTCSSFPLKNSFETKGKKVHTFHMCIVSKMQPNNRWDCANQSQTFWQ